MLEIALVFGLLGLGLALLLFLALGWLLVKLVFKIVVFPVALAVAVVKIAVVGVLGMVALVLAPVLLTLAAVIAIPLLLAALFVGLGLAVFAAAA